MTRKEWSDLLEQFFHVPQYRGVYVLGSFAKHVTLYSQQVRALNLVAGLVQTEEIQEGTEVVVVGGGAAGLTAAAAAAKHKARVVVLEEFEGLMELQGNNRQRWLHPHIYDWPDIDPRQDKAELPFLGWSAAYAESVARQIEDQWTGLQGLWQIDVRLNVRHVQIEPHSDRSVITWSDKIAGRSHTRHKPVIILAVGFGLEPQTQYGDSYWAEDNIDSGFRRYWEEENSDGTPRRSSAKQRWLVSGFGDGALTDLMRLCLKRFRHAEIADWFEKARGINKVKERLREMHASGTATAAELTEEYDKLVDTGALKYLQDVLKPKLREQGPEIFLAGRDFYFCTPRASTLNCLVTSVLRSMSAFVVLLGPVDEKKILRVDDGWEVPLREGTKFFNRIILRHGPTPRLESAFRLIAEACKDMRKRWQALPMQQDKTRKQRWEDDFYGAPSVAAPDGSAVVTSSSYSQRAVVGEVIESPDSRLEFSEVIEESISATATPTTADSTHVLDEVRFGLKANSMEVSKLLMDDGKAILQFAINGLSAISTELHGIRFYCESIVGQVGRPELDEASREAGFAWVDDPSEAVAISDFDLMMTATREKVRKLGGMVRFPSPLKPSSPPLSFIWSVTMLNADALSTWEYNQAYSEAEKVHVNGEALRRETEFLARVVWFPIDKLKLSITLPGRTPGPAFPSFFLADEKESIPRDEVIRDHILQVYPSRDSRFRLPSYSWRRQDADNLVQSGQFTRVSSQTWELSVPAPRVGSCYTLDWRLPESAPRETGGAEEETALLRQRLLDHRVQRLKGRSGTKIQKLIAELFARLFEKYGGAEADEKFSLSLLAYDESNRRLRFVDGLLNGREPSPDMWALWLPFAAGLAGVTFKQQADFPFIYFAPEANEQRSGPEAYLTLPGQIQHSVLVAMPLTHPAYKSFKDREDFEIPRLRIGVLDIGSDSKVTKLRNFQTSDEELVEWSRTFALNLFRVLRE